MARRAVRAACSGATLCTSHVAYEIQRGAPQTRIANLNVRLPPTFQPFFPRASLIRILESFEIKVKLDLFETSFEIQGF
jgi:hypothetical protein